ncbi:PI31 proteasome regulator N-terminal-domain-containing protein [Gongronella butleri]|nr:PI31 proteasome regulator N-terminal-domain-containing protein [Gongronella butleri]
MHNVLDPSSVVERMIKALPNTVQSPYDALMLMAHAAMLSVGFKYAGLGDDARQEGDGTQEQLPDAWNQQGPHVYAIRYSHPQSSMTFIIKSIKLAEKWIIHGLAIEDNKTATLEIATSDYTSASFFPYASSSDQSFIHGFISSQRLNDLLVLYKINIIQRLIPGIVKPGYEEEQSKTTTTATSTGHRDPASSSHIPASSTVPPSRPPLMPPIFDPATAPDQPSTLPNPFSVGRDDLDPLHVTFPGQGGGMYVGPGHPMFGRRDDDPAGVLGGGPQSLPRGSVPPGARFDPIGPFQGRPPTRGRRPPRQFPGEPDNDEPPPPGFDNMFM